VDSFRVEGSNVRSNSPQVEGRVVDVTCDGDRNPGRCHDDRMDAVWRTGILHCVAGNRRCELVLRTARAVCVVAVGKEADRSNSGACGYAATGGDALENKSLYE